MSRLNYNRGLGAKEGSVLGQWEATERERTESRDLSLQFPVPCYTYSPSTSFRPLCDPQWIPVPLVAYTNVYSRAFFAAYGPGDQRRGVEQELDLLRRAIAPDAAYDSLAPTCHPGTRQDALHALYRWALDTASELEPGSSSILCLQGPPGSGKSVILRTIAQGLHAAGRLGGNFVFRSRQNHANIDNAQAQAFFRTLAYQLATNAHGLRAPIARAVRRNPDVLHMSMGVQLRELILEPLREIPPRSGPLVLVIDGIDQCSYETQREILCLLGNAVRTGSQFRVLLACRPGEPAVEILAEPCFAGVCRSYAVGRSVEDVRIYLAAQLGDSTGIEPLAAASGGCFLYASTMIRFLRNPEFYHTRRRALLENPACSPLDDLYVRILGTIPAVSRETLLAVLHLLVFKPFAELPLRHIEQLLGLKAGRLRRVLRHLDAVLEIPESDSAAIGVRCPSFLEFLVNPTRSGSFCVGRMNFAGCMLQCLSYAHESLQVNQAGHVAWTHLARMVDYITSQLPSMNLVPLVVRINPDFFFGSLFGFEQTGGKILAWLKEIEPQPVEAIRLWEDYEYMAFFHSAATDFDFDEEALEEGFEEVLIQHPALIRLLRLAMILPAATPLFPFRLLLGASWEDLRSVICPLRPILGTDSTALAALWTPLRNREYAKDMYPWSIIFADLARQSIRIAKGERIGAVPSAAIGFWLEWGRYIRSSPPCPKLLRELHGFEPREDENECHDVLKWLQSFEDPPRKEIARWMRFLPEGSEFERDWAYEGRWASWRGLEWYG